MSIHGISNAAPQAATVSAAGGRVHGHAQHGGGGFHHVLQQAGKPQEQAASQIHRPRVAQPALRTAQSLAGTVVGVDAAAGKLVVQPNNSTALRITVVTDDETHLTVNGRDAAISDLRVGMNVFVLPPGGTAREIRAYSIGTALFLGGNGRLP